MPSIQDRAPALVAESRSLRAVLVTAVPGVPAEPAPSHLYLQAGRILRALHDSIEQRAEVVAERSRLRMERELRRCRQLGITVDEEWVGRHVGAGA